MSDDPEVTLTGIPPLPELKDGLKRLFDGGVPAALIDPPLPGVTVYIDEVFAEVKAPALIISVMAEPVEMPTEGCGVWMIQCGLRLLQKQNTSPTLARRRERNIEALMTRYATADAASRWERSPLAYYLTSVCAISPAIALKFFDVDGGVKFPEPDPVNSHRVFDCSFTAVCGQVGD